MSRIIGIDLGTTNSLCACFEDDGPKLIPNQFGEFLTPSVVGMVDGQVLVGKAATELRVVRPDDCVWCFKRWMGTDRVTKLGNKQFTAPELSSLVLRSLKADAEKYFGEEVTQAVITVPAYFNDDQRQATKMAGELAGLTVRRIINEPSAAALTYGYHDKGADKRILVFDLGGGTFDVTVMELFEGSLEIVSTAGESHLGGEDFTQRLVSAALKSQGLQLETAELKQPRLVSRLREEAELAKLQLSTQQAAYVRFPNEQGDVADPSKRFKISQRTMAELSKPLLKRVERPIAKALRDADCQPGAIDDVILVGGATRMAVISSLVEEFFGKPAICSYDPDEVVALGAAVQAALIEEHRGVDDIVLTDVCPFSMGIEIVKQFGNQINDGYYMPIIHRNTTIPVSREEVCSTVHPNQSEVLVKIYQGESRKVKDNHLLGELKITGIPPGPAGQQIYIRFTYDINGILDVEAIVKKTGRKYQTTLTRHVKGMSEEDLKRAIENLQKVKFFPRDEAENQQLVLFCERVLGEISHHERSQLELMVDTFEDAMNSGDREYFHSAKQQLLISLSSLGFAFNAKKGATDDD